MGLTTTLMVAAGTILAAALANQAANEFRAWTPALVAWLLKRAVAKLPEARRERLTEEWQSHLEGTPGEVAKIITACGFNVAALRMQPSRMTGLLRHLGLLFGPPAADRRVISEVGVVLFECIVGRADATMPDKVAVRAILSSGVRTRHIVRLRLAILGDIFAPNTASKWGTVIGATVADLLPALDALTPSQGFRTFDALGWDGLIDDFSDELAKRMKIQDRE